MPPYAKRTYQVSDLEMIQHATTMREHFLDDQAEFAAFDPQFAASYETAWQQAIDSCIAQHTDETRQDQQQQLTQEVKDAIKACQAKFRDVRYFVRSAFADSPATQEAFGIHRFHRAQYSRLALLQLMYTAYDHALEHSATLATVGFDASAIEEIRSAADHLRQKDIEQSQLKRQRKTMTHDRIRTYNALWNIMQQVSRAAKYVFNPVETRASLYVLPWPKRDKKQKDESVLQS